MTLQRGSYIQELTGTVVVPKSSPDPLSVAVNESLSLYFDQLDGTEANDLYQLVIAQVEKPLFYSVMRHAGGNQSKAAQMLGISRSTLRKKLAQYEIQ